MLKQTVSYHDFDDNPTQETLYFNLTKSELADNLHLEEELRAVQVLFEGGQRQLTTAEITRLLELVKTFMRLSYGVRSSDGKRFVKTADMWTEFTQTAVYDAFLFSLFEEPDKAVDFMLGILPKDLRSAASEAITKGNVANDISQKLAAQKQESQSEPERAVSPPSVVTHTGDPVTAQDAKPLYQREHRKPTTDEFLNMSQDELAVASEWIKENNLF